MTKYPITPEVFVNVTVGWNPKISKNSTYRVGVGKLYIDRGASSARFVMAHQLKQVVNGVRFDTKKKVYLHIVVHKPDMRSDAVNVIDTICDVVKKVIGVDDRYFAIALCDWCIDKEHPRIEIGIAQ